MRRDISGSAGTYFFLKDNKDNKDNKERKDFVYADDQVASQSGVEEAMPTTRRKRQVGLRRDISGSAGTYPFLLKDNKDFVYAVDKAASRSGVEEATPTTQKEGRFAIALKENNREALV